MTLQTEDGTFRFQAEVSQLLDLMAHSLYSNKEIFLRELISNASDAIDRLRLETYINPEIAEGDEEPRIRVSYDKDAGTITVADNGIGMSRDEVIEHIGTIAKSGTSDFLKALSSDRRGAAGLIGQFGVGFYSAFVVAEQIMLTTRRTGLPATEAVRWTSDGKGEYTLETIERQDRGTTIVLYLRDGEEDLPNPYRLRKIIQKYSDHITVPIVMPASEKPGDGEDVVEDQRINEATALWARPKSEIPEAEYIGYYRHSTNDFNDPLTYLHTKVEGRYEYTLLLFIPSKAPHDLWTQQVKQGVKLHVQRVFILEDTGQLLPKYLRFVRGIIDSADLPLNVSRELLQTSLAVDHIRTTAVRRVLKLLTDLAEHEPDKYAAFWTEFGAALKEGIADDFSNRDQLAALLRFPSTTSDEEISLSDYISRMKDGQDKIYYLLAPSLAAAKASPHLEAFRAKGIEVLLLGQGVDNFVVTSLPQGYQDHELQSVTQGLPHFGELEDKAEKEAAEQAGTDNADLIGKLKAALSGLAWDVRVTNRLTTSPACIVSGEAETDFTLAQRMRGTGLPKQPVLEINPGHPLIERLNARQDDPRLTDWAHVLFNQAVLTFGARIENPAAFVAHLNDLLISLAA